MAEDMAILIVVNSESKAEFYQTMMEDHDIPVDIIDQDSGEIAVRVPLDMIEEAKYVLSQSDEFVEEESVFDDFDEEDDDDDDDDDFSDYSPLDDDEDMGFEDDDDDDDDDDDYDDDDDDDGYGRFGGYDDDDY